MDRMEAEVVLREQKAKSREEAMSLRVRVVECASRVHQGLPLDMAPGGPFWKTVDLLEDYIVDGRTKP